MEDVWVLNPTQAKIIFNATRLAGRDFNLPWGIKALRIVRSLFPPYRQTIERSIASQMLSKWRKQTESGEQLTIERDDLLAVKSFLEYALDLTKGKTHLRGLPTDVSQAAIEAGTFGLMKGTSMEDFVITSSEIAHSHGTIELLIKNIEKRISTGSTLYPTALQ